MYTLYNEFSNRGFMVAVVGCGGTGAFVTEGLCRFLPPYANLVLIDHDRVEEGNLIRQNFTAADLGHFKSEALAKRMSSLYDRPLAYSTLPIGMLSIEIAEVIIGCVDNGLARKDIAGRLSKHPYAPTKWWIDSGNGENYGQVIIGNHSRDFEGAFDAENGICLRLPFPTLQRPELLQQKQLARGCTQAIVTGEQSPVINQAMASLVLEVVRRLLNGTCPWMQLYLDLETGSLSPVFATPELVSRLTGIRIQKLERR